MEVCSGRHACVDFAEEQKQNHASFPKPNDRVPRVFRPASEAPRLSREEMLQSLEEKWETMAQDFYFQVKEVVGFSVAQTASAYKVEKLHNQVESLESRLDTWFGKVESDFAQLKSRVGISASPRTFSGENYQRSPRLNSSAVQQKLELATILGKVESLPEVSRTIVEAVKESSSQVQKSTQEVLHRLDSDITDHLKTHVQSVEHVRHALDQLHKVHAQYQRQVPQSDDYAAAGRLLALPENVVNQSQKSNRKHNHMTTAAKKMHLHREDYREAVKPRRIERPPTSLGSSHHIEREKSQVLELVQGATFTAVSSFVIVVYTVLLGIMANTEITNTMDGKMSNPGWFKPVNTTFLAIFVIELLFRMAAEKLKFFIGEAWAWNIFDFLIVVTALLESVSEHIGTNISFFRVIKIARMFRAIRILRVFRYVRDLRVMVCSIGSSLKSLGWAFLLLGILLYCCGVTFCMGIAEHLRQYDVSDANFQSLRKWYRSVPFSMYSLVLAISGGMDWHELVDPLSPVGTFYVGMFILYTLFVVFGMLNVLTGVFVERAQELAHLDRDLVVQCHQYKMEMFSKALKQIFREADEDGSGLVTKAEFNRYCERDDVRDYLSSMGLPVDQTEELFEIFNDSGGVGGVDIDDFINGCMRVQGHAGNLDVLNIQDDVSKLRKLVILVGDQIAALSEVMEAQLAQEPDPSAPYLAHQTESTL